MKKNLLSKILGFVGKTIKIIITIFAIVVIGVILIQRIFNNNVTVGGYRIFTVVTGSMEPVYNVFDVILSKQVDPNTIEVGDDVVYLGNNGGFTGKIITHRVIKKEMLDGKLTFQTQGVNNSGVDPIITGDQIYGVVVKKIYTLSYITKTISNPIGFMLLVIIPISVLIAMEVVDITTRKQEKEEEEIEIIE